jgi:hypothetical protein
MRLGRGLSFWADEWDFLATRTGGDLGDLIRPHVVHLSTLPILTYRMLWWLVGIRAYWPYRLVIVVLHLVGALLVRAVMRRAGVRPWTATVVASVLVLFGSGYENILWPFQMTQVGSLVFGFAHLLLADHDGPFDRRDWAGLLAGLAAILCSAVGITTVLIVGFATLIRRGPRLAVAHVMPLEGLYLLWLATVARADYDRSRRGSPTMHQVASFVEGMITNTFRALGQRPAVGIALGVVLITGLVIAWYPLTAREFRTRASLPVALLLGTLGFTVTTGLQRATWGPPAQTRYLYIVAFLMLPVLAVAADALIVRWRALGPIVLSLFLIGIPGNLRVLADFTDRQREAQQLFREMTLTLPRVRIAQEVPRSQSPQAGPLPCKLSVGWLLSGVASGRIPPPDRISRAEAANETLRMSIVELPACPPQVVPRTAHVDQTCGPVLRSSVVELHRGEALRLLPGGIIRLVPVAGPTRNDFPRIVGSRSIPKTMIATASIAFRVMRDNPANLFAVSGGGGDIRPPSPAPRSGAPTLCSPVGAIGPDGRAPNDRANATRR